MVCANHLGGGLEALASAYPAPLSSLREKARDAAGSPRQVVQVAREGLIGDACGITSTADRHVACGASPL
ncbi:MAG TPA: hypothetical protein VFA49_15155 [Chloroflexota bacterium]|nr:hypothetical protein [Chloroflexota bacterium]